MWAAGQVLADFGLARALHVPLKALLSGFRVQGLGLRVWG